MSLNPRTRVAVISVSIDLGAGRRGVDMGPSALRIAAWPSSALPGARLSPLY